MPRRRAGELISIEVEILLEGLRLASTGQNEFHGFGIAKGLRDGSGSVALVGHGTLYKALGRLEQGGLLESWWESPDVATDAGRPRRRLYRVTAAGRSAAAVALSSRPTVEARWSPGIEPA